MNFTFYCHQISVLFFVVIVVFCKCICANCLIKWFVGHLVDQLTDSPIDQPTERLTDWSGLECV